MSREMASEVDNGLAGRAGGHRHAEIVRTAADLFDSGGYYQTRMEDIATAVGLRKSTLYHYFTSKEDLLFWIHDEFIDLITSRHETRLRTGMTMRENLLEVMADILELMETHRGHVRVFFEHHRELPRDRRDVMKAKRDAYEAMVERVIRRGVENGEFRDVDPRLTAFALFGICNWAYQWYRRGGPLRTREIAYQFWDLFVRGIAAAGDDT